MENTVVWADIPVTDLDRAMKFYGAVLQREFKRMEGMEGVALEAPPADFDPSTMEPPFPVAFDLAVVAANKPSTDGCTIYLNSGGDPEGMLRRAADAGGEILQEVPVHGRYGRLASASSRTPRATASVYISRRRCRMCNTGRGAVCVAHHVSPYDCPRCGKGDHGPPRLVRNR